MHDRARDQASGRPTGKRQHKPFVITTELDKASPRRWQALAGNEELTAFELKLWAPQIASGSGTGVEIQNYTLGLHDASIASIHFAMPNDRNPELLR